MLLRLLKVRVIVNDAQIYYLEEGSPVVIPIAKNGSKLVASDGFHHSAPLQVNFKKKNTLYFKVGCIVEDDQLIAGAIFVAIVYAMGFTSDVRFIQVLSFAPILYFLYLYYINRREFLKFQVV
ncbi:MAG: hypothetical protein JWP69_729 [Flaviaesturariibacter sp.]|nr:hypothetical protein [Flaviaesturariibacter sp.]